MALYKLLCGMNRQRFAAEVVVLRTKGSQGTIGESIEKLGLRVHELGIVRRRFRAMDFVRLLQIVHKCSPDIVQTWLYHPNVLGGIAARLCGVRHLVWNLRSSPPIEGRASRSRMWAFKAGRLLSSWLPEAIVSCSDVAMRKHLSEGYRPKRAIVIPNGFEVDNCPSNESTGFRHELGLRATAILIGMVARFHPDKDHKTFVRAAGYLNQNNPGYLERHDIHFVLCGEHITWENPQLAAWIDGYGLRSRFHLLGRRTDPAPIISSFDIASLTSVSEAFPNVVGEAMACEVPCVVTDVGEAAFVVGPTGTIVKPGDAESVAAAWQTLVEMGKTGRQQIGRAAKERIRAGFSIRNTIEQYEALYSELSSNGA